MNAYELDQHLLDYLHQPGGGNYTPSRRLRALNRAYGQLCSRIQEEAETFFAATATLSKADGSYTLPVNCYKVQLVQDADGEKLDLIELLDIWDTTSVASVLMRESGRGYYQMGTELYVIPDEYGSDITVSYIRTAPLLHWGTADGGSLTTLQLNDVGDTNSPGSPSTIDDYYNDVYLDLISGGAYAPARVLVTDYTANPDYTITFATLGTAVDSSCVYGFVPLIPQEFHSLLAKLAAIESLMTDVDQVTKVRVMRELMAMEWDSFTDWLSSITADGPRVVRSTDAY